MTVRHAPDAGSVLGSEAETLPAPTLPSSRIAVVLGLLAGVLYNSWPLGFLLDRPELRGTYISVLEIPGRPHAHVFVACDLAAGTLALVSGLLLQHRHLPAAVGLVMFGLGTALEASIPIAASCAPSVASCGIALRQVLAPHDLASILSVAGLAVALSSLRDHSRWMRAVTGLGVVTGLFLLASVVLDRWVMLSQTSFLVGCGVALAGVPRALLGPPAASPTNPERLPVPEQRHHQARRSASSRF